MRAKKKATWPHKAATTMTPHPNGQWCKKIKGRIYYFGPWSDPEGALRRWQAEAPDLMSGREPLCTDYAALTVKACVNAWLTYQQQRMTTGDISDRTYSDYLRCGRYLLECLGRQRHVGDISPLDWTGLRTRAGEQFDSPHTVKKIIIKTRQCFKWAYETGLLEGPVRFGPGFKPPSTRAMRLARAARGQRLFTPSQILRLSDAANDQVKAMILLGINAGFGNTDCSQLRIEVIDLGDALIDYARAKTGVPRTVPLWPETVGALQAIVGDRSEGLVFVTRCGNPWVRSYVNKKGNHTISDSINQEFGKLKKRLKIKCKLGFYDLRHTFRTIADECCDDRTCDRIMGHASQHISADYVERIKIERLRRVTEHVRAWLIGQSPESPSREDDGDVGQEQEA